MIFLFIKKLKKINISIIQKIQRLQGNGFHNFQINH